MKRISFYIASLVTTLTLGFTACSPDDVTHPYEGGKPLIADYADKIQVTVDQTTNQVTFGLADGTKGVMPIWIFDGKTYSTVNGLQKIFTKAGDYSVDVQVMNRNGVSDGTLTKTFHVDNTVFDFTRYQTMLTGGEGQTKTWRVAAELDKHLGCGPTGTTGTEWYGAQPNEKAEFGIYDVRLDFDFDGNYTFDPKEKGMMYVNTGCTNVYPELNTTGSDYSVPMPKTTASYSFDVVGEDLYLVLPAKTPIPYVPNDAFWLAPRFKVESMSASKMELIMDEGSIAWHLTLVAGEPATEEVFKGFNYSHAANLWKAVDDANPEVFQFYATGNDWASLPNFDWSKSGSEYKLTLPTATVNQWQAQFHLKPAALAAEAAKHYDFSAVLSSSTDHPGMTIKLCSDDDAVTLFDKKVTLKAFEEYVFYVSDFEGADISKLKLVFDFGGNAENTEIAIRDIVLKDHAIDDGTKLPAVEETPAATFEPAWEGNLWRTAQVEERFFYYAPGWAQIADPVVTEKDFAYTIALPAATADQWQAQVAFKTNLAMQADKKYDFYCVLESNEDHPGVTIKLVENGNDDSFYFADRHALKAYEPYVYKVANFDGKDMAKVNLFFDFGGNKANTEVIIRDIIVQEHRP